MNRIMLIFIFVLNAYAFEVKKFTLDTSKIEFPYAFMSAGYGSGLSFKSIDKYGNIEFYGLTDRGPNLDAPHYIKNQEKYESKFFPMPDFVPNIAIIQINAHNAKVIAYTTLKYNGQNISGRVIPQDKIGSTKEIALNLDLKEIEPDENGLDTEGITRDKEGNFWLCDEYGPFIIKTDSHGNILEKYSPSNKLPSILSHRIPNRGFEGITVNDKGEIIAIMQSVLDINNRQSPYIRILKFNPQSKKTTMYAYPIDKDYKKNSDAKIGDIVFVENESFLVIEQGKQKGIMQNLIYKIDLKNADEIPNNEDLEYNRINNIKTVKKNFVLDLRQYGWDKEKAEGLALFDNKRALAVINDNDFNIKLHIKDTNAQKAKVKDYTYNANTQTLSIKGIKTTAQFDIQEHTNEQTQIYIFYNKEQY